MRWIKERSGEATYWMLYVEDCPDPLWHSYEIWYSQTKQHWTLSLHQRKFGREPTHQILTTEDKAYYLAHPELMLMEAAL